MPVDVINLGSAMRFRERRPVPPREWLADAISGTADPKPIHAGFTLALKR
ncbi:MAG: hypothetical protein O7B81_01725 [Gammaproteobacteria bacterium]|nr:hypothetical protein [Gammaproteobacteria bacterium]